MCLSRIKWGPTHSEPGVFAHSQIPPLPSTPPSASRCSNPLAGWGVEKSGFRFFFKVQSRDCTSATLHLHKTCRMCPVHTTWKRQTCLFLCLSQSLALSYLVTCLHFLSLAWSRVCIFSLSCRSEQQPPADKRLRVSSCWHIGFQVIMSTTESNQLHSEKPAAENCCWVLLALGGPQIRTSYICEERLGPESLKRLTLVDLSPSHHNCTILFSHCVNLLLLCSAATMLSHYAMILCQITRACLSNYVLTHFLSSLHHSQTQRKTKTTFDCQIESEVFWECSGACFQATGSPSPNLNLPHPLV